MEFQPITPPKQLFPQGSPGGRPRKTWMLPAAALILLILLALLAYLLVGSKGTPVPGLGILKSLPLIGTILDPGKQSFLRSNLPSVKDVTIADIPGFYSIDRAVKDGNTIWLAGGGFIGKYDISKKSVVAWSDREVAGRCADLILTDGSLYAACDVKGLERYAQDYEAFKQSVHNYAVFKIDPRSGSVIKVFTPKDGLRGVVGYRLYADAADVWVAGHGGVGRIQPNGSVTYFSKELGIAGTTPTTDTVIVDGTHVWVESLATEESKGGISLYDKTKNTWRGFDPDELQERERDKVDIEALKLIPGGIQIAYRDGRISGTIRLVERQHNYATGQWTKINDLPTTGDGGIGTYAYVQQAYPQPKTYTVPASNGLSQLREPTTGQIYPTNGRRSYVLSQELGGKKYLLTSATIDVIEDSSPINRTVIQIGEGIGLAQSFPTIEQFQEIVQFAIEPGSMRGLIVDTGCDPRFGCGDNQKAWLVDLKTEKLVRAYSLADGLPNGKLLKDIKLEPDKVGVAAYNNLGIKLFAIDTVTGTLQIPH